MKPLPFIRILFLLLMVALSAGGCRKAFLAEKPSTNLLIPNSLTVLQELLDNEAVMNVTPALGEVSADNYYLLYAIWTALDVKEYNAYIWAPDLYEGQGLVSDWDFPYQQVFYANTVLQSFGGIQADSTDQAEWNMLKGWALFCRAYAFFNIAELFAPPYDSTTAVTDPGIPIRLSPDINVKTTRASLQASYAQILSDLQSAEELLPTVIPARNLNRPSRLAAQALLARIYLSVGDYKDAGLYADSVLQTYSFLLDYNSVPPGIIPIGDTMEEILYQSNLPQPGNGNLLEGIICDCLVDSNLVASYAANDLRPSVFYLQQAAGYTLNGSYSGSVFPFTGLATDELYLIRAECSARAGDTASALHDLNFLLMHRWVTGTFTPYPIKSEMEALDTILVERRKELAFRGIRWSDLRRLNKKGWNITLTRNLNGVTYTLLPNSELYTLPIPPDVINFSGIKQNPR
jgi:starch-binding outer membrane protein, SusD/RagB family